MSALNATAKSPSANAFLTVARANTILTTERLYTNEWTAASDSTKERSVIWATRLLSDAFSWYGSPTTVEQALPFPRAGLVNPYNQSQVIDDDTIPLLIERVTADLALELIKRNRTQEPELIGLGIKSASVGPLSVEINPMDVPNLLPASVMLALQSFGTPNPGTTAGLSFSPVVRT